MLIATDNEGQRIQAGHDLGSGSFTCPMCDSGVILKRGRKVAAHFAHMPGSDCPAAEGESWRHLMAKQVLVEEFSALGYRARMEVDHRRAGRRVDVAVILSGAAGLERHVAVEIQDSSIQVDTMKARTNLDKRLGYHATTWLFTSHRAGSLLLAGPKDEVKIPAEMLWVINRYQQGIHIIDPEARSICRADVGSVYRDGESHSWYEPGGELTGVEYPGYSPRTLKTVERRPGGFHIEGMKGRYPNEYAILFT
ncbi:competence protein CoiA family protein [Streptomyces sp. NBC_00885]|uniref:competence protein CoiA n=1 Tax=Streptomyces sp. NBC_00885 TaxID=2975857 RepID=UPI00386E6176|nr:competence protein CoiA family protein [Streptomyces sp. NBC_00885]